MEMIYETISVENVRKYDNIKYNVSNLGDIRPKNYYEVLEQTYFKYYVNTEIKSDCIRVDIELTSYELKWMTIANHISTNFYTGKFSKLHEEDLNDFVSRHENLHIDELLSRRENFVRTDFASFKYGQHGTKPYRSLKEIMESYLTCRKGHSPFEPGNRIITLYLIPYVEIDHNFEFRVFVYKNKITAVSQQNIYKVNEAMTPEIAQQVCHIISEYFTNHVKICITHIDSYVMDIALIDGYSPYFIEVNPFGKEYSSGSALFHWIIDEDKLMKDVGGNIIHFRCTKG